MQRPSAYDVALIRDDMRARGFNVVALARATRPRISHMTVLRFLNGTTQTAKSAQRIAKALGQSVDRYLIRSSALAS